MEFLEGAQGLFPGISTLEASGHTPGSTVLLLESAGEKGLLLGDLVHSEPELYDENWDFVNHVDHKAGMASIEQIRKMILHEDSPFTPPHFTGVGWGRRARSPTAAPISSETRGDQRRSKHVNCLQCP